MKVGDLVLCTWQPRVSRIIDDRCVPMDHTIKGEFGIIVEQWEHYHRILFPQLGYEHDLSESAIEMINEAR